MTEDDVSLVRALQRQTGMLMRLARHCEAHGFCVIVGGQNEHAENDKRLYRYMGGAFQEFVKDWCKLFGKKYVLVWVRYNAADVLVWNFTLPRTREFRPIVVALELMSRKRTSTGHLYEGVGIMDRIEYTNRFVFKGHDKDSLEAAIGILSMEHHKEIMRKDYLHA